MADQFKAITAQNQFTDYIVVQGDKINVSIWGTFVGTVTVQRSFDDLLGSNPPSTITWLDVKDFTAPGEWVADDGELTYYRVGIKTGNYTSGAANVRIGSDKK